MEQAQNQQLIKSKANKKRGMFLILGPIILLVFTLIAYALVAFLTSSTSMATNGASTAAGIFSLINMILGLFGIISVIGIIIGVPVGIIFLLRKEVAQGVPYDERSGKKAMSEVPTEIKGWNWGAMGLGWIWGVYHNVWISLLVFIPIINIVMIFVLGAKGNEWAWRSTKWLSVEHFKQSQKKWKPWGITFLILGVLFNILSLFTD